MIQQEILVENVLLKLMSKEEKLLRSNKTEKTHNLNNSDYIFCNTSLCVLFC